MSTTREVADTVARSFGFDRDGFVTCDPAALIDAIDKVLQAERECAAKIADERAAFNRRLAKTHPIVDPMADLKFTRAD